MQRVDADERPAERARPADERIQVSEVPDAPIPLATNAIEIGNETEAAIVAEQIARRDAPRRHDDEHLLGDAFASLSLHMEPQPMIPERRVFRPRNRQLGASTARPGALGSSGLARLENELEPPLGVGVRR